jgi:hypothetical protein
MSLAICKGFLCHLSTMLLIMSTCSGGMPKEDSLSDSDGESSTEIAGVSCWGSILCGLEGFVFRVLGTDRKVEWSVDKWEETCLHIQDLISLLTLRRSLSHQAQPSIMC